MPAHSCASSTSTGAWSGGDLVLQLATGDGPQAGMLTLRSFALSNEPALRRIIPTQTQVVAGPGPGRQSASRAGRRERGRASPRRGSISPARPDGSTSRMRRSGAARSASRSAASSIMPATGWTSPAPSCRPTASTTPSRRCRCSGRCWAAGSTRVCSRSISASRDRPIRPTLTVNPLSAVAPGFLRKLFGVGRRASADQAGSAARRDRPSTLMRLLRPPAAARAASCRRTA